MDFEDLKLMFSIDSIRGLHFYSNFYGQLVMFQCDNLIFKTYFQYRSKRTRILV